jgi:hypothetical protein
MILFLQKLNSSVWLIDESEGRLNNFSVVIEEWTDSSD